MTASTYRGLAIYYKNVSWVLFASWKFPFIHLVKHKRIDYAKGEPFKQEQP